MGKKVNWKIEMTPKEVQEFNRIITANINSEFKPSVETVLKALMFMSKEEVKGVDVEFRKDENGKVSTEMVIKELEFTSPSGDKLIVSEPKKQQQGKVKQQNE